MCWRHNAALELGNVTFFFFFLHLAGLNLDPWQ